jgi:sugar phosphate permease
MEHLILFFNQYLGKILISIAIFIYGYIPILADFNKTHATNPSWPAHARFHVVWQVFITFFIANICFYLLWQNTYSQLFTLNICFLCSLSVLGSFFLNWLLMKFYDGGLSDQNGIKPIGKFDLNLLGFAIALFCLIIGYLIELK